MQVSITVKTGREDCHATHLDGSGGTVGVADVRGADDIEYRQNVYKALGGHTSATAAIIQNEVSQPEHLVVHARNIAQLAGVLPDLFPEGSGSGDTDARAAIWERPDAFAERMSAFQDAAAGFYEAASGGDRGATARAFMAMAQTCRGCHDDFRD
jgi:cytochrome c556